MAAPEATITEYGLANGTQAITKVISNAFSTPGYVVKVSTTAGTFSGTSAITDVPDGYTIKSCIPATAQLMVNTVEGSAQANQSIGVQAMIPGQEAYLLLGATAAVTAGDFMAASATAGKIIPRSAAAGNTDLAAVVFARALESKLTQAGGTIRVRFISPIYLATTEVVT